jgi:crossover junction endonuclease MUS81
MLLLIDYREQALLKILNLDLKCNDNIVNVNYMNMTADIKVCNLEIGDFIIKNEGGEIFAIIERKTFSDLCSSIVDGRFREQKSRISECIDSNKVMYILEGSKEKCRLKQNNINGSVINLIWKHKFKVLQTTNENDTLEVLFQLYKKLSEPLYLDVQPQLVSTSRASKKGKFLDNPMIHILETIPGVSLQVATSIAKTYGNMNELMEAYIKIGDQENMKEVLLSDIIITEKRKVGKSLSKKIYQIMFGKLL